ncbi:septum formation initiator family protein [Christensenellaceae bacterium OttesenSCG-928-L17]|nr:septum formation initiator family protein [Christensenellaceae bacterium OttesenSCG-928-L17]
MKQLVGKLRPRHILGSCLAVLLLIGGLFFGQRKKLAEIEAQQAQLQEQYAQLQLEEDRLKSMVEYAQTDEYKEQLAREKFGYVAPDDFKFYIEPEEQQ